MSKSHLIGLGWSTHSNAAACGQTAARVALQPLAGRRLQGAIVFGSAWFDQAELVQGVQRVLGDVPIAGGSTAGEITPEGPKSHSCVVLALAEGELAAGIGVGLNLESDPRLAGYQAAHQALELLKGAPRRGFLFFGDGLLTGYAEALRGMQEVLGTSSLVTGALMGDDFRFATTYQYTRGGAVSHAVTGVLLGGACTIGVGVEHGFEPISKPRRVTKAKANVLYELDGQPASSVYEDYFGSTAMTAVQRAGLSRQLIAYPLGVQLDATGQFLLRTIKAFGADGSVICTGEIQEQAWVQLMIGSKEQAIDAAERAAQRAAQALRSVHAVLVLDSVVRKRLLGQEAGREIARIRHVIGPSVPLAGCYTYGEQTPLGESHGYGRSSIQTGACLVIAIGP